MAKKSIRTVGVKLNIDAEVIPVTSQLVSRIVKAHVLMHNIFDDCVHEEEQRGVTKDGVEVCETVRHYSTPDLFPGTMKAIDENVLSILDDLVSAFEEE